MTCPSCESENPNSNQFCGQCGVALDPRAEKLRLQVEAIVQESFKDRDLVATSVADTVATKVETRLKGFGWILGTALAILAISVSIYGCSTIDKTKAQIASAEKSAVDGINAAALNDKKSLDLSSQQLLELLQREARPSEAALSQFPPRIKALSVQLAQAESGTNQYRQKLEELKKYRDESPGTTIGSLPSQLFQPSLAIGGKSVAPYVEGSSGHGVTTIQLRLKELGCYAGPINGVFDSETLSAVQQWKRAQVSAFSSFQINPSAITPDTSEQPTSEPFTGDAVGSFEWTNLFLAIAKKC